LIEAGTSKPAPFDVVIVRSFSRVFCDHFELEFYVRKLAKNSVRLVSIESMAVPMEKLDANCRSARDFEPARLRK